MNKNVNLMTLLVTGIISLVFKSECHSDQCPLGQVYTGASTQYISNWQTIQTAMENCKKYSYGNDALCTCTVCAIRTLADFVPCDGEDLYNNFNNALSWLNRCGSWSNRHDYNCSISALKKYKKQKKHKKTTAPANK